METVAGTWERSGEVSPVDALLAAQRRLTAVERFSEAHDRHEWPAQERHYRRLLPAAPPAFGQQYAFEVDLDRCSGCKGCVTACHSLNGLEEGETWRKVGLLVASPASTSREGCRPASPQHVTTACHHCADPGCLNGCPVLAYDKDPLTGIVRHLDDQCMGCGYCVMKCPYEVPQYSATLGIVRKCDLCADRLAVGEAPACVQGCPHEAIRITVVERQVAGEQAGAPGLDPASAGHSWLPDSPSPEITQPTTRFVSTRLPADMVSADHGVTRLEHPHWPLALMLVLTQAATGLFLGGTVLAWARVSPSPALAWTAMAVLVVGLGLAPLHLGRPSKAWRAFLGWRKSWLSRELLVFNLFAGLAGLALLEPRLTPLAAAAGLVGVAASAMVYVDTRRPLWCARITFGNFFGTTLLLGAALSCLVLVWSGGPGQAAQALAGAAILIRAALFLWRRCELGAAFRNPASPFHLNARTIVEQRPALLRVRTLLFWVSNTGGLLAMADGARAWLWASAAAAATLSAEVLARHLYFVAGSGKRMPGGLGT